VSSYDGLIAAFGRTQGRVVKVRGDIARHASPNGIGTAQGLTARQTDARSAISETVRDSHTTVAVVRPGRNAIYVATLVVIGGIVGASTVGAQSLTQAPPPAASPAPSIIEEDAPPYSTALGAHVLVNNTSTGIYNTGLGRYALFANTTGSWNTATGDWALTTNTEGRDNTATGASALYYNTGAAPTPPAARGRFKATHRGATTPPPA
jgi:hypothetical protein